MNKKGNNLITQLKFKYTMQAAHRSRLIGGLHRLPLVSLLFILCSLLLTLYTLCFTPPVYADWGETGAAFLKIGVGARQIGMGGANVALANDVNAIYWNPAGLTQLGKREFTVMHNQWIVDFKYDFIGFAHPLKKALINSRKNSGATLAGGLVYLNLGEFQGRDEYRNRTNNFKAYDTAGIVSYAQKISPRMNLGLNLKYIYEQIEVEHAKGLAVDLGFLYQTGIKNLNLGFTVRNLGPKMKFISEPFSLPLTLTAGTAYTYYGLNLACDVSWQPIEERTNISLGTEYWPFQVFALRAGYLTRLFTSNVRFAAKDDVLGKLNGIGAGFGFRFADIGIDYCFVPYGDLGNTHRLSFSSKF